MLMNYCFVFWIVFKIFFFDSEDDLGYDENERSIFINE